MGRWKLTGNRSVFASSTYYDVPALDWASASAIKKIVAVYQKGSTLGSLTRSAGI